MSQGKRLVLDQDDFLDEDDDAHKKQHASASTSGGQQNQQKISVSSGAAVAGSSPGGAKKTHDELLAAAEAHRKSLIGIGSDGARGFTADDLAQLSSVTLSKRHQFAEGEYEGGADPNVYQNLSGYDFDKAALAAAAAGANSGQASGSNSNAALGQSGAK